jgi:hypothetical protein
MGPFAKGSRGSERKTSAKRTAETRQIKAVNSCGLCERKTVDLRSHTSHKTDRQGASEDDLRSAANPRATPFMDTSAFVVTNQAEFNQLL